MKKSNQIKNNHNKKHNKTKRCPNGFRKNKKRICIQYVKDIRLSTNGERLLVHNEEIDNKTAIHFEKGQNDNISITYKQDGEVKQMVNISNDELKIKKQIMTKKMKKLLSILKDTSNKIKTNTLKETPKIKKFRKILLKNKQKIIEMSGGNSNNDKKSAYNEVDNNSTINIIVDDNIVDKLNMVDYNDIVNKSTHKFLENFLPNVRTELFFGGLLDSFVLIFFGNFFSPWLLINCIIRFIILFVPPETDFEKYLLYTTYVFSAFDIFNVFNLEGWFFGPLFINQSALFEIGTLNNFTSNSQLIQLLEGEVVKESFVKNLGTISLTVATYIYQNILPTTIAKEMIESYKEVVEEKEKKNVEKELHQ